MNENQREAVKTVVKAVATAWGHIKKMLMKVVKQFKAACKSIHEYRMKHRAVKEKTKLLRQSWDVKQDTRRASQVMNNKPRVNMPKIMY
jgi:hypothetical protein